MAKPEMHPWILGLRPLLRSRGRNSKRAAAFLQCRSLRWAESWGWEENILGLCVSRHKKAECLTFLVDRKVHKDRLTRKQYIPELLRHPELKSEIATRVLECGGRFSLQSRAFGGVRPGLPIGHEHGFPSGTLGYVVQPQVPGAPPCILSCAHVMAWTRKGMFPLPRPQDFIEQPVSLDADPEDFRVARLTPQFSDLTRSSVNSDFALAAVLPSVSVQGHPLIRGVSGRFNPATDFPRGLSITMIGQASGAVRGTVLGTQAVVALPTFGNVNFPFWHYNNLILYSGSTAPGDSGAAVVETANGNAVGLHVGGNGNIGLMFPIAPIFRSLNLSLI